jgi:excisionase family DNA binding protein
MDATTEPALATVEEIAQPVLGMSVWAVYRLIRAGNFPPAVHLGTRVKVNRKMLDEFISTGGTK